MAKLPVLWLRTGFAIFSKIRPDGAFVNQPDATSQPTLDYPLSQQMAHMASCEAVF